MPDDKSKRGKKDRSRVTAVEGYEVSYFARKHGITSEQARNLIARVGNNRDKLNAAAEEMTGKTGSRRRSQPSPDSVRRQAR